MKLIKGLIALTFLAGTMSANAAIQAENNKLISQLVIFSSGVAYVTLHAPSTITTNNCGIFSLVKVEIDTSEKRMVYSTLLAAKTANQPINIVYDDHDNSNDCTLTQVNLLDF